MAEAGFGTLAFYQLLAQIKPSADHVLVSKGGENGELEWRPYGGGGGGDAVIILGSGVGSSVRKDNGNISSGLGSTVSGGCNNINTGSATYSLYDISYNTISGGYSNSIIGCAGISAISSGGSNIITGSWFEGGLGQFIGGGIFNLLNNSRLSSISGGSYNEIVCSQYSFIGGGALNTISGYYNTFTNIVGGNRNTISCQYSTISGGVYNTISGIFSVISGGKSNTASCSYSVVSGGVYNTASGLFSAILGGRDNNTCGFDSAMIVGACINANRSCTTFVNNLSIMDIPISSAGLPSGSVWNDSGTLRIV